MRILEAMYKNFVFIFSKVIPRKLLKMYSTQQPPAYGAQPQYNLAPMQAPVPTNNADLESGIGDLNIPKNIKEIKGWVRNELFVSRRRYRC